jgi:hypothetical protein
LRLPGDWGACLGNNFRGRVQLRRTFNAPSKLDSLERVWLVCEGVDPGGAVTLNGCRLGDPIGYAMPAEFEITRLLLPHNELMIEVDAAPVVGAAGVERVPLESIVEGSAQGTEVPYFEQGQRTCIERPGREYLPGGIVGEIRLEIRTTQFIDGLALYFERTIGGLEAVLQGIVRGDPADEPLEIVATGPEGELMYGEAGRGAPFELRGPAAGIPDWSQIDPLAARVRLAEVHIRLLRGGARLWETLRHAAAPAEPQEGLEVLTQIDEKRLLEYDLAGRSIVQAVPWNWMPVVCRRLAHHPSIAAWQTQGCGALEVRERRFGRMVTSVVVPPAATAKTPPGAENQPPK